MNNDIFKSGYKSVMDPARGFLMQLSFLWKFIFPNWKAILLKKVRYGKSLKCYQATQVNGIGNEIIGDNDSFGSRYGFYKSARVGLQTRTEQAVIEFGNNITILKNTLIGNNSIVAAGAVAWRHFPGNVIIVGVSARIIKTID